MNIVGYCRVSTPHQRIQRQIDNLKAAYPNIIIIQEVYTGTTENRPKWQKLLRQCRAGNVDKLVFDEVSRFSRNAEEAIKEYKELYNLGIELEFLKEPHINSSTYKQAFEKQIKINTNTMDSPTSNLVQAVVDGINDYILAIAEKQIYLAFERAQSERDLLSKRTSEGLRQAKLMGSKVGRQKGQKIETKKAKRAKRIILKHYKMFGGELTATECYCLAQITKSTFYRYLKELNVSVETIKDKNVKTIDNQEIIRKIKKERMIV